jgi:hypothetical protein
MGLIRKGYLKMDSDNNGYMPCVIEDDGGHDGRPVVCLADNPDCIYVLDMCDKGKTWDFKPIHPRIIARSVIQVCRCNKHYAGVLMFVESVHDDYIIARVLGFNGRDYYQKIVHGEYYYIGEAAIDI